MRTVEDGAAAGRGAAVRRRIYLARHGDVTYFDAAGLPVLPQRVPLNEEGRGQAQAIARLLAAVALDRIVASGLPRTIETATPVAEARGLRIEVREALEEIRPGRPEDLGRDIAKAFRTALPSSLDTSSRFLGGETFGEFFARVIPCFRSLAAEPDWEAMLVVAHGGVNRAILLDLLGAGPGAFEVLEQDPGAVNIIDVAADGSAVVRLVNHTPASPAKEGLTQTTMERLLDQYLRGR